MSEVLDCPYCGAAVHTDRVMDYDNKIKLRCNNCGGFFEYMPGFGAFRLPEHERRGPTRHEGSAFRPHYEIYEDEVPWGFEKPPEQQDGCGTCCGIIFCLCFILPMIVVTIALLLGLGFFWFW